MLLLLATFIRVKAFTVDDAYISFRYARNLARGLGLVYNPGERVEGYTNFLWTVLLAGGIKLGVDPELASKILGGLAACGGMTLTYAIANRLRPLAVAPCLATWLLASTVVFSGYAVFGLETPLFVALVLLGTFLFLREEGDYGERAPEARPALPLSGLAFALAGLTRPEAPLFLVLLVLFLGRGVASRRNLVRLALFAAPLAAHLLWRHSYYGAWLPNTLSAKTGEVDTQIGQGVGYVKGYIDQASPVVWLALFALAKGLMERRRALLALAAITVAFTGYVVLVGGDWMPFHRFLAPAEPFLLLLVDVAARDVLERRSREATLALALFGAAIGLYRASSMRTAEEVILTKEKRFWDTAAAGVAAWLNENGGPGAMALGDIGYVGWSTDRPIFDMLGLVDPVIAKLPGAYTQKLGRAYNDHFFEVAPRYFLVISSKLDCKHPSVPNSRAIYGDARFKDLYALAGKVRLDGGFAWCVYENKAAAGAGAAPPP
jgi:hypothetical protein